MKVLISLVFTVVFQLSINAFTLDDKLVNKSMEKRANDLFEIIKCPICFDKSLSESESEIAHDIRKTIRKKICDGYSNQEIILELKNFYGDSIIITPLEFNTYILWLVPLVIFLVGGFIVHKYIKIIIPPTFFFSFCLLLRLFSY
ncbi:MAG: cytochrome c-type biogenesis protein CcmH [Wolbachia endosymbiont of Meromenopon meropis]|nr:cytochrome c-type biogenesis protein CcmH [Wolbachia endosymbiont of Meromenopon meropis]